MLLWCPLHQEFHRSTSLIVQSYYDELQIQRRDTKTFGQWCGEHLTSTLPNGNSARESSIELFDVWALPLHSVTPPVECR